MAQPYHPIGVFDSGYGGLTILEKIRQRLPEYDYLYLGDNARAPYGTRSFDLIYRFTLQAVKHLFEQGCPLVILGCNTASAKALRTLQQRDFPDIAPARRVLGVIRPTAEAVTRISRNGHVGVLGTPGTIQSGSYNIEIAKQREDFVTTGHGCPMWVPLIENNEADKPGADYFVKQEIDALLSEDASIDSVILACTHYPLLLPKIRKYLPKNVEVICQGDIVAESLADYLQRHPEMETRLSKGGKTAFETTENARKFSSMAATFLREPVDAVTVTL